MMPTDFSIQRGEIQSFEPLPFFYQSFFESASVELFVLL